MQVVRNEFVVALGELVRDVEGDNASFEFRPLAQQFDSVDMPFHEWTEFSLDKGLVEHFLQAHLGEQREDTRHKAFTRTLDNHGQLHGRRGHLYGGLRALVSRSVDDIGPIDQIGKRRSIEAKLLASYIRDQAGTGDIGRIVKLAAAWLGSIRGHLRLGREEISVILWSKECALMVIKPPGDLRR